MVEVEPGGHVAPPRSWGLPVRSPQRKGYFHGGSIDHAWAGGRLRKTILCAWQSPRPKPIGFRRRSARRTRPFDSICRRPGAQRAPRQPSAVCRSTSGHNGRVRTGASAYWHGHLWRNGRAWTNVQIRSADHHDRDGRCLVKRAKPHPGPNSRRFSDLRFCRIGSFDRDDDCRRSRRNISPNGITGNHAESSRGPDW